MPSKALAQMAKEILRNNKINAYVFLETIRTLLQLGRQKNCNILLVVPVNCGKRFLLSPLTEIYDTFSNPSSRKYAYVGAENKELIFLNDLNDPLARILKLAGGSECSLGCTKIPLC